MAPLKDRVGLDDSGNELGKESHSPAVEARKNAWLWLHKNFGGIKALRTCMYACVCKYVLYLPQWGKSIFSLDPI